jgi:hypothetical protein
MCVEQPLPSTQTSLELDEPEPYPLRRAD